MPGRYSFRARWWALALAAFACAAGIALGQWQSRRADEKRAAAQSERVALQGRFVAERTVLLDNRLRRGRPGYEVVTPLKLSSSDRHVLVNRGWVEAGKTRAVLPEVHTPAGEVRLEGFVRERLPRALEAGPSAGKVRQNLDIGEFAKETGLKLEPKILEQHSALPDGLDRDWPRPEAGFEKNQMYALQWYSLAALAVILAVVLSFRKA